MFLSRSLQQSSPRISFLTSLSNPKPWHFPRCRYCNADARVHWTFYVCKLRTYLE
ncbi:Protein of unknown function [Pyronema omphalodes CBS 100304]|uniref:Uncharacterized protein n=1 Tax=Pyronema omphalodes (strain CBS 100304) TaxID=1076935 RepID=U4KVZ7_PYROM|nr:Protein of unknown function [Pyronema omphalodes CBS 100304]